MSDSGPYPVDAVLPELLEQLATRHAVILEAPPGAGKTTRVPPALLHVPWLRNQRIIMLEPRRLAARSAARFMAAQRGEIIGQTVGYRVRGDTRCGPDTRIEVVTEGVLTRMLSADPTLTGIGAILFDEFHERSVHADLGLAMTLHLLHMLREDLRIVVMSATLESDALASVLRDVRGDAPVVRSRGHAFPVEVRYRPSPATEKRGVQHAHVVRVVADALRETTGDMLVFLPGVREMHACAAALHDVLAEREQDHNVVQLHLLHGSMALEAQDAAIAPAPAGCRKVVLATNVAETSLTIEGVRVVVDAGWSRQLRYDARIGLSRLETARVTQASAEQRRGRAGRMAPGICYRLWDVHEHSALLPRIRPEILDADLTSLALALAESGMDDAGSLRWLDAPSPQGMRLARSLLSLLGALDTTGRLTPHGRAMAALPLHPRLAHLLLRARELVKDETFSDLLERSGAHAMREGAVTGDLSDRDAAIGTLAAVVAACVEERDVMRGVGQAPPADITLRVEAVLAPQRAAVLAHSHSAEVHSGAVRTVRETATEIARRCGIRWHEVGALARLHDTGALLALAFPDRIARRRDGQPGRYLTVNGSGASLPPHDPLYAHEWLAVAELGGMAPEYRIVRAAPLSHDLVVMLCGDACRTDDDVWYDATADRVRSARRTMLGQLPLESRSRAEISAEDRQRVLLDALREHGLAVLPVGDRVRPLLERLQFLHYHDRSWPDVSDEALLHNADHWIGAALREARGFSDLSADDVIAALLGMLTWQQRAALDEVAPATIVVPSGSRITVDYSHPAHPLLSVKLQEVFGWLETPRVLRGQVPITLQLLSPAQRPVQVTQDLARFWREGYYEVRKELRGRYPKHPWPDDPLTATPTRHTARRR